MQHFEFTIDDTTLIVQAPSIEKAFTKLLREGVIAAGESRVITYRSIPAPISVELRDRVAKVLTEFPGSSIYDDTETTNLAAEAVIRTVTEWDPSLPPRNPDIVPGPLKSKR